MKNIEFKKSFEAMIKEGKNNFYEEDRQLPENFSYWYNHIVELGFFISAKIISNQIFDINDLDILQYTDILENINKDEIEKVLAPTLNRMESDKLYSIKNGCFSNKFDFETCISNKKDLYLKLWKINYMASLYETGGYTEIVVRDLIPYDKDNKYSIYNGMPLREEIRVFYDIDEKIIKYIVDYWDFNHCYENMPNDTDKGIFKEFCNDPEHQKYLEKLTSQVIDNMHTLKFDNEISGIWSIDFLYDRSSRLIYLIDMARAEKSDYYNIDKCK